MKKAKTWIITCIYLQLLLCVTFGNPCGNPVTDAVNDIEKLVGNLPNDYNISLEYVPDIPSLPKQCWVYLMIHKVSHSLGIFILKFANTSQNYSIMSNLTAILHGIRDCLALQLIDHEEFIGEFPFSSGSFVPKKYFEYVSKTILLFKEIDPKDNSIICLLPSTTVVPQSESKVGVTKPYTKFSFMPSSRRNHDKIVDEDQEDLTSSPVLETTYVALIALSSLVLGFVIGVVCWKIKHREPRSTDVRQEAEQTSMFHRTEKAAQVV